MCVACIYLPAVYYHLNLDTKEGCWWAGISAVPARVFLVEILLLKVLVYIIRFRCVSSLIRLGAKAVSYA